MKRGLLAGALAPLLLTAALVACVPTKESDNPLGGVVVTLVPSAETAGAPFVTLDGWTIRIEHVFVRGYVVVESSLTKDGTTIPSLPSNVIGRVVNVNDPSCTLRATAVPARLADVSPSLVSASTVSMINLGYPEDTYDSDPPCGVDAETAARFLAPIDANQFAPTVIVALTATNGSVTKRLDTGLEVYGCSYLPFMGCKNSPWSDRWADAWNQFNREEGVEGDESYETPQEDDPNAVIIPRDAAVSMQFEVHAEALFHDFDYIAAADADRDGVITADELAAVTGECQGTSRCRSLLDTLGEDASILDGFPVGARKSWQPAYPSSTQ